MGRGYPQVMTNSLLLNMSIEIVDLSMKHGDYHSGCFHFNMVDLSTAMSNYQRVPQEWRSRNVKNGNMHEHAKTFQLGTLGPCYLVDLLLSVDQQLDCVPQID